MGRHEGDDRRRRATRKKRYKSAPQFRAGGPVDPDDRRRRRRDRRATSSPAPPASTTGSACAASIIRLSRPIPDASAVLPLKRPPLMREHRLYQSDWLMRFYGFRRAEVAERGRATAACCRSTSIPSSPGRSSFASAFPVDVNRAPREAAAARARARRPRRSTRILAARRWRRLRARRCRAADRVDREGAAVHHRRRLAPGRCSPIAPTCARWLAAQGRAARTVRGLTMLSRCPMIDAHASRCGRGRFRRLARRRARPRRRRRAAPEGRCGRSATSRGDLFGGPDRRRAPRRRPSRCRAAFVDLARRR